MTAAAVPSELIENGVQNTGFLRRLKTIWQYRELLVSLARRELKVKYKDSAIGFLWSLLNPLLYLAIFSVVFGVIIRNAEISFYSIYLLAGLLPFNLFSLGLTASTTSITANSSLVQKVWFPREVLPISAFAANFITFCLQMLILFAAMAIFQIAPAWELIYLLIPATAVTLLLGAGTGVLLSALNVYFRDVQHFLELALLVLFWFTPIVYPLSFLTNNLPADTFVGERLGLLNPLTPIVTVFHRVLYNPGNFERVSADGSVPEAGGWVFDVVQRGQLWHLGNLIIPATLAVGAVYFGFRIFAKLEGNLGEEL